MEFTVIKAPEPIPHTDHIKIFLGGTIDMGESVDWQSRLTEDLSDDNDVMILNPRRDDWDSSWKQDPSYGTPFRGQVEWELDAQNNSDILVYYFAEGSNSPITLPELGLYANSQILLNGGTYVVVYCNEEYWRYGNVKIICDRYDIPVAETYEELLFIIKG